MSYYMDDNAYSPTSYHVPPPPPDPTYHSDSQSLWGSPPRDYDRRSQYSSPSTPSRQYYPDHHYHPRYGQSPPPPQLDYDDDPRDGEPGMYGPSDPGMYGAPGGPGFAGPGPGFAGPGYGPGYGPPGYGPPGYGFGPPGYGVPGTPPQSTVDHRCIANFLRLNPKLDKLKEQRDKVMGWRRWLKLAIFAFLLFFPMLPQLTNIRENAWVVAIIWLILLVLLVQFYEYWCRAELWWICICRGIILDFRKTHNIKAWALNPIMFIAYFFMFFMFLTVFFGSVNELGWGKAAGTGVLFLIGLGFVVLLTKEFIDIEGSPRTPSVNMLLFFFNNPDLLLQKGYKTVHETRLRRFVEEFKGVDPNRFTWDTVYELAAEEDFQYNPKAKAKYFWGIGGRKLLKKMKDLSY